MVCISKQPATISTVGRRRRILPTRIRFPLISSRKLALWVFVALSLLLLTVLLLNDFFFPREVPSLPDWDPASKNQAPLISDAHWHAFRGDYQRRSNGRDPPQSLRSWLSCAEYYSCNERDYYQIIEHDLLPFRRLMEENGGQKFQYKDVVESARKLVQTNYIALVLHDHTLTVTALSWTGPNPLEPTMIEKELRWLLQPLVAHTPPLYAIMFFNLHDHSPRGGGNTTYPFPIFSTTRMAYWTEDQPPPTEQELRAIQKREGDQHVSAAHMASPRHPQFDNSSESWDSPSVFLVPYFYADRDIQVNQTELPFQARKDVITWRGATSGYEWGLSPRFVLTRQFPQRKPISTTNNGSQVIADFAFTNVVNKKSQAEPDPPLAPSMSFDETRQNKYIMDVDGNTFTERFPKILRSGSVVFKSSRFREWYSERLQPYVDYIPVNYNLSDLVEKVEWIHHHPQHAQFMVEKARYRSQHDIRGLDMRCYTYRLMLEYMTLFE